MKYFINLNNMHFYNIGHFIKFKMFIIQIY